MSLSVNTQISQTSFSLFQSTLGASRGIIRFHVSTKDCDHSKEKKACNLSHYEREAELSINPPAKAFPFFFVVIKIASIKGF